MTVTEEITRATEARQLTRERRYARRSDGVAGNLVVTRTDRGVGFKVNWSARTGGGWGKHYTASFPTESAALAFAETKWTTILGWIAKRPAEQNTGGAAALFSAQVATLRR